MNWQAETRQKQRQKQRHDFLIKKSLFLSLNNNSYKEKTGKRIGQTNSLTGQKHQKVRFLGQKMGLISRNKYSKISLIYWKMATAKNIFGFEQIRVNDKADTILIFEEINKELEEYLLEKSIDADSTDGVFDFLETLSAKIQEELDKLIESDSDKKRFIKALTRIFALLLNTKVDTADKVKRILKMAIETYLYLYLFL